MSAHSLCQNFASIFTIILLSSCALRAPVACGNAAYRFDLSPGKPTARHPVDSRGDVRLVSVHRDGRATFEFIQSHTSFTLRPSDSYFNPRLSEVTITLHSSDPAVSNVSLTSQIVP
jgi:hypothetical protein